MTATEKKQILEALERLGPRHRDVLRYYAQGLTAKEIADTLNISPKTVESYRADIAAVLRARSTNHMCVIIGQYFDLVTEVLAQ